jgi:phage gp16-like protein
MLFSNTKFGLKLKDVVDVYKTTKDYKTVRYYQIKNEVKTKYEIEDDVLELDDEIQDE